jgi:hypothetical protein
MIQKVGLAVHLWLVSTLLVSGSTKTPS